MALIVEDGSIVAGAESYISTADATTYHAARGNTAWATLSESDQEIRLRRATDYMSSMYGTRWAGRRITSVQALDWPRYEVYMPSGCAYYPMNEIPEPVRRACAELALRAVTSSSLAPDVSALATRVKIGPIEKEYAAGTSPVKKFRFVDDILQALLSGGGAGTIRLVRA